MLKRYLQLLVLCAACLSAVCVATSGSTASAAAGAPGKIAPVIGEIEIDLTITDEPDPIG